MGKIREQFEPWLRDYLRRRYPELEPTLLRAIVAFETVQESSSITPELLAPIVEAASSSRRPLYENATGFMGILTGEFAEAREAVKAMANDVRSHVRLNAILCLAKSTPHDLTVRLLQQGLQDKSANVRQKAADWAGRLRMRDVVPDLESAAARENNAKTKATIEFELKLLRDGYILEPGPDDGFEVTTFTNNGIASRWIAASELKQRGVDAIVAELARDRL
jgi:HEAT repeats